MTEDDVFEHKEKYTFLAQIKGMFEELKSRSLEGFKVEIKILFVKDVQLGASISFQSGYY